jgi:hypothetical protein
MARAPYSRGPRLISLSDGKVCFRWKDYRQDGKGKVMVLQAGEFIRRFLMHTLPVGFHRIRHYGANGHRANKIELCRKLLAAPSPRSNHDNDNSNEVAPANDPPTVGSAGLMNTTPNGDNDAKGKTYTRR